MIITLCRRGLLKVYASFCELNISFYKTLTFRFADYTKKEALSIIQKMDPKATWDMQVWSSEMKKHNLHTEDSPCYNDYALYVAMNQVVSDHGETVAKILGKDNLSYIDDDHLLVYAYSLAVD